MFSNKLCVRNSSYAKWELHTVVDGNWIFLTTERVNSLRQKFSRFIGELQRHSLDIHVMFFFSMCLWNYIRCSCSVPSLRWMHDQLSDKWECCLAYAVWPWRQNSLAACFSNFLLSKNCSNDVNFWQVTAFPFASYSDLHETSKQTSTFA